MNKKGFTLVELLAVIVILAIILAIAVPTIMGIIDNTKNQAIKSDAQLVLKQMILRGMITMQSNGQMPKQLMDHIGCGFRDSHILFQQGIMEVFQNPLMLFF